MPRNESSLFGIVFTEEGKQINSGYTLHNVLQLAADAINNEEDLYSFTGDLAIAPQILVDLVERIKELELLVNGN